MQCKVCNDQVGCVRFVCCCCFFLSPSLSLELTVASFGHLDFQYVLQKGKLWIVSGFTKLKWLQTAGLVTVIAGSTAGAYVTCQFYNDAGIRIVAIGGAFLIFYVCFRYWCF